MQAASILRHQNTITIISSSTPRWSNVLLLVKTWKDLFGSVDTTSFSFFTKAVTVEVSVDLVEDRDRPKGFFFDFPLGKSWRGGLACPTMTTANSYCWRLDSHRSQSKLMTALRLRGWQRNERTVGDKIQSPHARCVQPPTQPCVVAATADGTLAGWAEQVLHSGRQH